MLCMLLPETYKNPSVLTILLKLQPCTLLKFMCEYIVVDALYISWVIVIKMVANKKAAFKLI